jgi:hypothetical protein
MRRLCRSPDGEDAQHEHAAALAAGPDRLPDGGRPVGLQPHLLLDLVVDALRSGTVRLHAHGLDADVGAAAAGVRSRSSATTSVVE